jgi:TM2 domain-containing membrane protein YozV
VPDDHNLPPLPPSGRPRIHIDATDLPPATPPAAPQAPGPSLWAGHAPMPAVALSSLSPAVGAKSTVLPATQCQNCRAMLDPRAVACPACGLPTPAAYAGQMATAVIAASTKSSGIALLLSLLWPGAGQIYVGRFGPGAAFMVGSLVAFMMLFLIVGLLLYPAVLIWAMIDAYQAAEKHNRAPLGRVPTHVNAAAMAP